jgi:hypothetical protein
MHRLRLAAALAVLAAFAGSAGASSTASGVSRDFNPAISVNTLLVFRDGLTAAATADSVAAEHEHEHAGATEGFAVQETELQFTASVDPYARASVTLAMHGTESIEAEEAFLQLLQLPRGLGLRAGAFYWEFGKHNTLHTHQYPFVERPVAWDALLGHHGLSGPALELSWLTPLPWFAELTATAAPLGETVYGEHAEAPADEWSGGLRLRQLWDLGAHTTLEIGGSGLTGDTAHEHEEALEIGTRQFLGADLTVKWTGAGANPRALELQAEWLRRHDSLEDGEETLDDDGLYASLRTRVTRRFWLGGRLDLLRTAEHAAEAEAEEGHHHAELADTDTWTVSLAFVPSEFQAWRVDLLSREIGGERDTGVRAQVNFTIGSHPAHRY